ncbi:hypothetical protein Droror1_Dr00018154, partial [Drosera rotundifolia]
STKLEMRRFEDHDALRKKLKLNAAAHGDRLSGCIVMLDEKTDEQVGVARTRVLTEHVFPLTNTLTLLTESTLFFFSPRRAAVSFRFSGHRAATFHLTTIKPRRDTVSIPAAPPFLSQPRRRSSLSCAAAHLQAASSSFPLLAAGVSPLISNFAKQRLVFEQAGERFPRPGIACSWAQDPGSCFVASCRGADGLGHAGQCFVGQICRGAAHQHTSRVA